MRAIAVLSVVLVHSAVAGHGLGPSAGGRLLAHLNIGVTIFFGAIFATLVTLFIVPVFYNLLARFTKSPLAMARRIEAFEDAERARVANAAE